MKTNTTSMSGVVNGSTMSTVSSPPLSVGPLVVKETLKKGMTTQPLSKKAAKALAKKQRLLLEAANMTSSDPTATSKKLITPSAITKKQSSKQQKINREKERREKQVLSGLGIACEDKGINTLSTIRTTDVATTKGPVGVTCDKSYPKCFDGLVQDSIKSRNRRLFLSPSYRYAKANGTGPCWGKTKDGEISYPHSVAQRLHDEILEYADYTRLTVERMTVHIEQMITSVRTCVLSLWPKSRVEPFGSYSTGIWLPSSDVDLVILDVVEINDRMLTVKNLRELARTLESQTWVESLVLLDTAKIPVLKLVTVESSVPIDITFESSATHSGLLARDLIKRYAEEMPALYPLATVFKQLLRERDLNDAYTGGLSSYSVVLMLIHFQLLWRYGDKTFKAAAIFASGSTLPRPADLIAEEKAMEDKVRRESEAADRADDAKEQQNVVTPIITTSFAAIVQSRTTQGVKRPVSEAGKGSTVTPAKPEAPPQPFSYAAVAAGTVKLQEKPRVVSVSPVSYAAAVAAKPSALLVGARVTDSTVKHTNSTLSKNPTGKEILGKSSPITANRKSIDTVSVSSSMADTEDALSSTESTTTFCDESLHVASEQPNPSCASSTNGEAITESEVDLDEDVEEVPVCLGEHTMKILEFFGILFDYSKNGLSIRDGGYIYRLGDDVRRNGNSPGNSNQGCPDSSLNKKLPTLVIEDPIHPDRNVSASSFAFAKVVALFEDSFYALKYFRPSRFTPSALSCLLSMSGHTRHHIPSPIAQQTMKPTSPGHTRHHIPSPIAQQTMQPTSPSTTIQSPMTRVK